MNKTDLINLEKTHNNFYTVCINAIKDSANDITDKNTCIKNIEKLRNEKFSKTKKKKTHSISRLYKPTPRKIESITLQEILSTNQESDIENIPQEKTDINKVQKEPENIQVNIQENNNTQNTQNIKTDNVRKKSNKKNTIHFETKNPRKMPKRYETFKKILEYLESNNITLKEYIEHNPFQSRPYQISKSFEFLTAVKFKNYKFIREALQYSNDYLFAFDYYGQTCYHWAAKLSDEKLLMMLIDNGGHLNQKDYEGRTPLYLAAVNNDRKICELLIRNKANVHLKDNNGLTPADVAGSKELKYYLGDLLSIPYSNPSSKQRIANFLRERESGIKLKLKLKNSELKKNQDKV